MSNCGTSTSPPHDQFITTGGRVAGPNETPVLEVRIPGTERSLGLHPKEVQARMVNPDGTQRPIDEVRDQAVAQYEQLKSQAEPLGDQETNKVAIRAREVADANSSEEVKGKKTGVMEKMRQIWVQCIFLR